ncbi:MAG: hypothetical protein GYB24_17725 [Rhodobacteraceae bacterium]|nr:hypothetical protein [Paracoccaceae bacterium]
MRNLFWAWYALFLIGLLSVLALMRVNDGAVLILSFDGDAIHMAQIVLRMQGGELPHQDFLTPLGVMAFLPVVWLMNAGSGLGAAFAYAPVLIGLVCLPAVYLVGITRFSPAGALAFGGVFLVQLLALVHGGVEPTVTVSMYYNNWCWAVSALLVVLAVLPPRSSSVKAIWAEALVLGGGVAFLTLTKAPFAVFLLPALIVALLVRGQWKMLGWSVVWALAVMVAVTFPYGLVAHWQGYVADLLYVARSGARGQPGAALPLMLLAPAQVVGNLAVLAAVLLLRQARKSGEALIFLVLAAGWILVTHQNWQNDPHWLVPAGLIVMVFAQDVTLYNRFGWPLQRALQSVAVLMFALGAPLLMTQVQSLLIHNSLKPERFAAAMKTAGLGDLRFRSAAAADVRVERPFDRLSGETTAATLLNGETLPSCQKITGLLIDLVETGKRLDQFPQTKGAQVLYADWVNGLWLFSDTAPLKGGAPWYYGGAAGFAQAEYLVVPLCPMGQGVRRMILNAVAQDPAFNFTEVERNELFILLKRA